RPTRAGSSEPVQPGDECEAPRRAKPDRDDRRTGAPARALGVVTASSAGVPEQMPGGPGGAGRHGGGVDADGLGWQGWRRGHSTGLVGPRVLGKLLRLRTHVWRDPAPLASEIRRRWGGYGDVPWGDGAGQPMLMAPIGVIRRRRLPLGHGVGAPARGAM